MHLTADMPRSSSAQSSTSSLITPWRLMPVNSIRSPARATPQRTTGSAPSPAYGRGERGSRSGPASVKSKLGGGDTPCLFRRGVPARRPGPHGRRVRHSHRAASTAFDGNKRTGPVAALVFLDLNGLTVLDPQERLYDAMIAIAFKVTPPWDFWRWCCTARM
jgi:hypothetical protein